MKTAHKASNFFLALDKVEGSRLHLLATQAGFAITAFNDIAENLPAFYREKEAFPPSDVRKFYPSLSEDALESLEQYYAMDMVKWGSPFTPLVTQKERDAEAALRYYIVECSGNYVSSYGSPLEKISSDQRRHILFLYGIEELPIYQEKILSFWKRLFGSSKK